jgi:hypothetical protein
MANALQERYAEVLLDRIRDDRYPSTTQMDLLEAVAPPQQLAEYVMHLLERISNEPHPSTSMMQRVQRLAAQFG